MSETQTQSSKSTSREQSKARSSKANGNASARAFMSYDPVKAMEISNANVTHWIAASQDLAAFWADRTRKNVSVLAGLSACRTPQDYMAVMARAASETVHDCAEEFDRLLAINLDQNK